MELTPQEAWETIREAARAALPEQTFTTWIASIKAVSLSDEALVMAAPTEFAAEWIEEKYGDLLGGIAARELGIALELRFEHDGSGERIDFPTVEAELAVDTESATEDAGRRFHLPDPLLNRRYTFEGFVVGASNKLAAAAARRVSDAPALDYNPLFIWGDPGLGKTHLLHAIGNDILRRSPSTAVAYVPSEQFTNEMIDAIRTGRTILFRERYRRIDLLLIDDVQFIANKEGTQEEFFHTFNALYDLRKQIVITSDRPPDDIDGLQNRLVSRFEWGLVTDIQHPEFETRHAILRKKADEDQTDIGDEVLEYVALRCSGSIRQLEGALVKLLAYSSLTRRDITLSMAREALGAIPDAEFESEGAPPVTAEDVRAGAANHWDVSIDSLTSGRRSRNVVIPRQVAMYIMKTDLDLAYADIGRLFGGRNHSTVIHSVNKVEAAMASDAGLRAHVSQLRHNLFGSRRPRWPRRQRIR